MAIGTQVALGTGYPGPNSGTSPQSLFSTAATLIDATGLDDTDNSGSAITTPGTQTTGTTPTTRHAGQVAGGSTISVAIVYPAAATLTTDAVVQLFGHRELPSDWTDPSAWTGLQWAKLFDGFGTGQTNHEQTIAIDTTNDMAVTIDGTSYKVTAPVTWDMAGCRVVLPKVKTALNLDSTNEASAFLTAWVV